MAAITAGELIWYETTTGPHRGGAITATAVTPSTLFDAVTGDEASAGATEYRAVYFKNTSANATGLTSAVCWIETNTPGGDEVQIAIADEGKNVTMETIADYVTAPTGPSFAVCATKGAGITLPTPLSQNDYIGIWIKRVVPASCAAYNSNTFTIKVEGDTTA